MRHGIRIVGISLTCSCGVSAKIAEGRIIALPIAIESHPPSALTWKSDTVSIIGTIAKVDDHDHIISSTPVLPTMEGNQFIFIIYVEDINVLTA